MVATAQAFEYVADREGVRLSEVRLNGTSWVTSPIQNGYTQQGLATLLQHTLVSCVLGAGSQLVKQVRGLPMGIRPAPQLANLTCYLVERDWVLKQQPRRRYVCRFIDDIFSVGYPLPSEVDYGMKNKITAERHGGCGLFGCSRVQA